MHPPLRIAILECDTPVPPILKSRGTYGDIFTALLKAGAKRLADKGDPGVEGEDRIDPQRDIETVYFDVVNDVERYPDLGERWDGVLITGSRHNSFDSHAWILALVTFTDRLLLGTTVPVIGVCFGHQIVGRALGGSVGRSPHGWEISVCAVDLSPEGRDVLFGGDRDAAGRATMHIHQMHRDAVLSLPSPLPCIPTPSGGARAPAAPAPSSNAVRNVARSASCPYQAFYVPGRLLTVQGHPEFDREIMEALVEARRQAGVFDEGMYRDGMGRAGSVHDGVGVGEGFVAFLREGREAEWVFVDRGGKDEGGKGVGGGGDQVANGLLRDW